MMAKLRGDSADVAQTARWQGELLSFDSLRSIRGAKAAATACDEFDRAFADRQVKPQDYPALVEKLLPVLRAAATKLVDAPLSTAVAALAPSSDVADTQRLHRAVLLRLDDLARTA